VSIGVSGAPSTLVCFAVKEEAAPFRARLKSQADIAADVRVLVTGMGRRNAANGVRAALHERLPSFVFTCGFAGALSPSFPVGQVVYDVGFGSEVHGLLKSAGAQPSRFHCADKVASTAAAKRALRESTGADVVEMESATIQSVCREFGVSCATVRVVSDGADEALPLDFNEFLTRDDRINFPKMIWKVLRSPGCIPRLLSFQRQTQRAAASLALVLDDVIRRRSGGV